MDHDQNFKNLILDYPREALKFFAREESEAIGPDVHILEIGDRLRIPVKSATQTA